MHPHEGQNETINESCKQKNGGGGSALFEIGE